MSSKLLKKQMRKAKTRQKVQKRLTGLAHRIYNRETYRTTEDVVSEYEDLEYFRIVAREDAMEHYYR